ncbi:MAG: hypothetical protein CL758_01275 [Chloroflexi bacterium]|nr:hypothetical protein [Chloroflexota bacterium]|tara:strand:- start:798 stop:1028 length:231 start_codon:yes stop_codon:yes gene_type:complete
MNINIGLGSRLPIQFLIVFIISAIITIYLGASVAEMRIEERNASGSIGMNNSYNQLLDYKENEIWENGFLWACPLH